MLLLMAACSAASGCKAVEQTHSVLLSCKHALILHAVSVLNMWVVCAVQACQLPHHRFVEHAVCCCVAVTCQCCGMCLP
jgi:hypothetical protein